MQRKNSILTFHSGIAMIIAIVSIIIIATIATLALSLSTQTTKNTTDIYLYEQAKIYSKSVAELALLKIAKDGCQNNYHKKFDNLYDANITMKYIYTQNTKNKNGESCNIYTYITTPEQNGSVLMDITITSDAGSEPIRYFRRTIQKLWYNPFIVYL